jgi:predicted nucleic acid-binding protein
MIVADTNVWIAYLLAIDADDTQAMDRALVDGAIRMAPVVLAELLSDPKLQTSAREVLETVPMLDLVPGFWSRAGLLRAKLIARGQKPKLADSLIAQVCVDWGATLITRDEGFRAFAKEGLLLLGASGGRTK